MIYILFGFVLLIASAGVVFRLSWRYSFIRWLFALLSLLLSVAVALPAFISNFPTKISEQIRRNIYLLTDVSASMNLDIHDTASVFAGAWPEYNIYTIPFSSQLQGPIGAMQSGVVESVGDFFGYLLHRNIYKRTAGVVIVSDGNETVSRRKLAEKMKMDFPFPVHIMYWNGNHRNTKFDKSVDFINVPAFLPRYKKERISFSVSVIGEKVSSVPVEIHLNGKVLGNVLVNLTDGYGTGSIEVVVRDVNRNLLEAMIPIDARESITDNNTAYAVVEGVVDSYRVLHIAGHPSVDSSFIRRGLQNIPGVDMISFFILRRHNQVNIARQSDLSLIPFPTEQLFSKELDNFDVIIINDFHLREFLPPHYVNNIRKFVYDGGGLLLIGGPESFDPADFSFSILGDALPFRITGDRSWVRKDFLLRFTAAAGLTFIGDIAPKHDIALHGLNPAAVKPDSVVFATTDSGEAVALGKMYGKGRVLAILTDSLWNLTYKGNIGNDKIVKSLIRYVLGISRRPVELKKGQLFFKIRPHVDNLYAEISYHDKSGNRHRRTMHPADRIHMRSLETSGVRIRIMLGKAPVDEYRIYNVADPKSSEFAFVPMGKKFLHYISDTNDGAFIETSIDSFQKDIQSLSFLPPYETIQSKTAYRNIYHQRWYILSVLALSLALFFTKSRYSM